MTSSSYEIRITGILPPEALLDFEELVASVEPVETVVHGQLPDQAALHGLLARLELLGVQVLEVRRLHDQPRSAEPASPDRSSWPRQPDRQARDVPPAAAPDDAEAKP
jgi:hypothetical protein